MSDEPPNKDTNNNLGALCFLSAQRPYPQHPKHLQNVVPGFQNLVFEGYEPQSFGIYLALTALLVQRSVWDYNIYVYI